MMMFFRTLGASCAFVMALQTPEVFSAKNLSKQQSKKSAEATAAQQKADRKGDKSKQLDQAIQKRDQWIKNAADAESKAYEGARWNEKELSLSSGIFTEVIGSVASALNAQEKDLQSLKSSDSYMYGKISGDSTWKKDVKAREERIKTLKKIQKDFSALSVKLKSSVVAQMLSTHFKDS